MEEKISGFKEYFVSKEAEVVKLEKQFLDEKVVMTDVMVFRFVYEKFQSSLESEMSVLVSKLKDLVKEKEKVYLEVIQIRSEVL